MYYGKAIGRAKEYILGPAFLLLFCFSVLQGADRWFAAQYISSRGWRRGGGIRHPTTNWLRQSVPRPSKGGQWGLCRFFGIRQAVICPPFKGRGTMRSMVVGCLGAGKYYDPWLEAIVCPLSALQRAGDHAEHGGGMLERWGELRRLA